RAIFVSLRSVWANHRHKDDEESEPDAGEITAVLARPVSYSAAYSLAVSYQKDKACQLVFPAQTVIRLFSIMGRGERFLSLIVHAVSGCAFLTTILILYWSTKERAPERALLRILGVPRSSLVLISWMEGLFTIAAGAIAGEILGRLGVYAAFRLLGDATAVDSSMPFSIHEAAAPVILLVTASLASLAVALGENKTGGELPPRR
ncbi:MAG: hypothetical protein LBQ19_01620, partial [Synergistaceae bacterium]|nr:hypothetical protein [Synergistaceae bacterium]